MDQVRHQIIFVSAQNVAEYLGARQLGAPGVCLHAVVTDSMVARSHMLADLCEGAGIRYDGRRLPAVSRGAIFRVLDEIQGSLPEAEKSSLAINLTGGLKLMTLAAQEWAYERGVRPFYVDTAGKRLVLPDFGGSCEGEWEEIALQARLNVTEALGLYGNRVETENREPLPGPTREHARRLLELATGSQGENAIAALNACAVQASANSSLKAQVKLFRPLQAMLAVCREAGHLELAGDSVRFADEAARLWCGGIWLEDHVRGVLARLKSCGRIQDWAASVQVSHRGVRNELDAAFVADNRLYVLECKTGRMTKSASGAQSTSILYKASSLRERLGGIYAQSMICSVNRLGAPDQERAGLLGVRVAWGADLLKLDDEISRWLG